jgi:UDPglucose 6-dehydrogenase
MINNTLGIVGLGYVGEAIYHGFNKHYNIVTYDIAKDSTCKSISELCTQTNTVFVCLPTPMKENGQCDISIVKSVLKDLNVVCSGHLIILKSTLPPTTTEKFSKEFTNLSLVFNPEFLTEANYLTDFIECNRVILGGHPDATSRAREIYEKRFSYKRIVETSSTVAEMVKYVGNTFLATKVSFANEMNDICNKIDINYDEVVYCAIMDDRLGHTHWKVPGPDGHYGFGGSCFPKDVNGLIYFAKNIGANPSILEEVWSKNLKVRPEKDWEMLEGRAITKNKGNKK